MIEFGFLDIVMMIIVLLGMWRGFKVGLIQSVVSLVGWFIAFFAGSRFAPSLAEYFSGVVESHVLQMALAFLFVVLVMITHIHVVASIYKKIVQSLELSLLDKVAGGILGAVRNIFVVLVLLSLTAPILIKLPVWKSSVLAPELIPYAPLAKQMIDEILGKTWQRPNGEGVNRSYQVDDEEVEYTEYANPVEISRAE